MEKEKMIKKPDPSLRRNIQVATLNKIKSFLKEQELPVYKSEIRRAIGVDLNSLNLALSMFKFQTNDQGQISIKKNRGKNINE